MQKKIVILICLPLLLLSACNFFYSTVHYTGEEAVPRLAIMTRMRPDRTPHIYVSRSVAFSDYTPSSPPMLTDANVTIALNGGTPVTATLVPAPVAPTANNYTDSLPYYTTDLAFRPGDELTMRVSHPLYGTAVATQVCPAETTPTLRIDSVSRFGEIYLTLHLEPYTGDSSDVITLLPELQDLMATSTFLRYKRAGEYELLEDTLRWGTRYNKSIGVRYLYSADQNFATRINKSTSSGLFAGQVLRMRPPTKACDIKMLLDLRIRNEYDAEPVSLQVDSLLLNMYCVARTNEEYIHNTTLDRLRGVSEYAPEPSSTTSIIDNDDPTNFDIDDILAQISDMFDALGGVEGYQAYSNWHNDNPSPDALQPFGLFALITVSETADSIRTEIY